MAKVAVEIDSVRPCLKTNEWALILKDKSSGRYLPIYIGSVQAEAIKRELLHDYQYPLPMDYDLSSAGIDTAKNELVSVTINRFESNIFFAKLLLSRDDKLYEIDYPPAKSIVLGLGVGAPIFAEEAVLAKAAIKVCN